MVFERKIASLIFLAIVAMSFLGVSSGCKKQAPANPVPVISLVDLKIQGDSSKVILYFKDGDGDIGLSQSDTAGEFRYNCFVDIYHKVSGKWVKQDFFIPYYYRIPILKKAQKEKPLEGEMHINLLDFPPDLGTPDPDTLKISVYIKDRALNKSNEVESDLFTTSF